MLDILFITPTAPLILPLEINGTMLLGTLLLDAGFSVDVLRYGQCGSYQKDYPRFIKEITDDILNISPRCVSFYTRWTTFHIDLRIAQELKLRRPDLLIVFGGPQVSLFPQATLEAFPAIDYACAGEGEHTVIPFFRAILQNDGALSSIPGLSYREGGKIRTNDLPIPLCDLNELPQWDDRLYVKTPSSSLSMAIEVGRGCPYNCVFCPLGRQTFRMKSPQRIVEDILHYNKNFGLTDFFFSHDALTVNNKLVDGICDHIFEKGLDITWSCATRIDCITKDLVLKMKAAGMHELQMGIETGSPRMQKIIKKNLDLDKVKDMLAFLVEHDIDVVLYFVYGLPEETEQDLNETLDFAFSMLDMGVEYVNMAYCIFFPKTRISEEYSDRLVFDPNIKILSLYNFGLKEELQMIKDHKYAFLNYYHLHSHIRDNYQYVRFLVALYARFPLSFPQLRSLYQGDHIKLYQDFFSNNLQCFDLDIREIEAYIQQNPLEILYNTIRDIQLPCIPQLKALMAYEYDRDQIAKGKEDVSIRKTYDFCYLDLKRDRPIEQYSCGTTEFLFERKAGVYTVKILNMR